MMISNQGNEDPALIDNEDPELSGNGGLEEIEEPQ